MDKNILYREKNELFAIYNHPKSEDSVNYRYTITIVDSDKNPIEIKLLFDGCPPSFAPMPPKEHTIKATTLIEMYSKLRKWFLKYCYILK